MTIRDWLASRTVRLHAFFTVVYSAALPVLVGFSDADWAALGMSEKSVVLVMAGLNILHGIGGVYMRSITTEPLKGRAE